MKNHIGKLLTVALVAAAVAMAGAPRSAGAGDIAWDRIIGADPDELDKDQKKKASSIMKKEKVYHGCKNTIAACLPYEKKSNTARRLAGMVVRKVKAGYTAEQIHEMIESGQTSFYSGPESERRFFDVGGKKPVPIPHDPHHIRLAALHDDKKLVLKENLGASLIDLGDGCLCPGAGWRRSVGPDLERWPRDRRLVDGRSFALAGGPGRDPDGDVPGDRLR